MKRILCLLLALGLLLGAASAEDDWDEFGENWECFESRFGFSLWYNADQLTCWTDAFEGEPAEMFCPWEDESGVAVLICRGSRFSAALWDGWTPIGLDGADIWLDYPCEMTAYTDGEIISEQWIISAPSADFVFIIQYEVGDYQGWAPLLRDTLTGLEFPNQPAETASFRLDFFQGGAAGMQFIDVIVDEDADPMVLLPLEEVYDFSLDSLDWDTSGDWEDWDYTPSPLYTAKVLSPGDNLLIYSYIPDMMPDLRIAYTDADGVYQCWFISQSGRDGSLLLLAADDL